LFIVFESYEQDSGNYISTDYTPIDLLIISIDEDLWFSHRHEEIGEPISPIQEKRLSCEPNHSQVFIVRSISERERQPENNTVD
jgi:hypothetical protein